MQTYEIYIEDSRYSVPTLVFILAGSDTRAKARAAELLGQSPCHSSVDIWKAGRLLSTVRAHAKAAPGEGAPRSQISEHDRISQTGGGTCGSNTS